MRRTATPIRPPATKLTVADVDALMELSGRVTHAVRAERLGVATGPVAQALKRRRGATENRTPTKITG